MKKKIIVIIFVSLFLVTGILYTQTKAQNDFGSNKLSRWGEYLGKNFNCNRKKTEDNEEIYAKGKKALISVKEMKQAIYFYEIQGNSEEQAKTLAYDYMKKSAALYAEASSKGYTITEEEVKKHVQELREFMESENLDETSKNQVKSIIEGFGSEEEYWKYEEKVYQKLLVSEKYVSDLQKEFYDNSSYNSEEWNIYFENLKESLVEKEEFQVIGEL